MEGPSLKPSSAKAQTFRTALGLFVAMSLLRWPVALLMLHVRSGLLSTLATHPLFALGSRLALKSSAASMVLSRTVRLCPPHRNTAVKSVTEMLAAASFAVEATYESWQRSFQADILGLIALIDTATPHLQSSTSSDASIVVVSSLAGFEARHPAIAGPYSTLKRAQATLAKDYSRKLGPLGVRINTVVPGAIETRGETLPDGTWQPSRFEEAKKTKPEFLREMLDGIPLERFGDADDVASAAVFLLSPLARYISGTNLVVDGGSSIAF